MELGFSQGKHTRAGRKAGTPVSTCQTPNFFRPIKREVVTITVKL